MKILVIAATEAEIALSIKYISTNGKQVKPLVFEYNGYNISFCVTGVGMLGTSYSLTNILSSGTYDLVIQAGIAGSFDRNISIGDVVFVRTDRLGDLGVEDDAAFVDVFEMGLVDPASNPYKGGCIENPIVLSDYHINLPEVSSITVNTVAGTDATVMQRASKYNCSLESMEGVAAHYVCISEAQAFIQVRAVSNYVEKRNRKAWKIEEAVNNLNSFIISFIEGK